jgi:hypothetical protein
MGKGTRQQELRRRRKRREERIKAKLREAAAGRPQRPAPPRRAPIRKKADAPAPVPAAEA